MRIQNAISSTSRLSLAAALLASALLGVEGCSSSDSSPTPVVEDASVANDAADASDSNTPDASDEGDADASVVPDASDDSAADAATEADAAPPIEVPSRTEAAVGANGGTITVTTGPLAGASVTIPPGALPYAKIIGIQTTSPAYLTGAPLQAVTPAAALTPPGTQFEKPVTVTLPLLNGKPTNTGWPPLVIHGKGLSPDGKFTFTPIPVQLANVTATSITFEVRDFSTVEAVVGTDAAGAAATVDNTAISTPLDGAPNVGLEGLSVTFDMPSIVEMHAIPARTTNTTAIPGTLQIESDAVPEIDLALSPSTGADLGGKIYLDTASQPGKVSIFGLTVSKAGTYSLTFTSPSVPGFTSDSATFDIISGPLAVAPALATVAPTGVQQFTVAGGTETDYVWSLDTNNSGGSISASGLYTAGSTQATDTIKVTDSSGASKTAQITVSSTLVNETFAGATAPQASLGGAALLTGAGATPVDPAGSGWLRLTAAVGTQTGYAYLKSLFNLSRRLQIDLDFATWGGNGADGIVVFLADGTVNPFVVGPPGSSLMYCQTATVGGMTGGYVGIGVDEWGGYAASGDGHSGGAGTSSYPNRVTIRGAVAGFGGGAAGNTTSTTSYPWLATSDLTGTLWTSGVSSRPDQAGTNYRHLRVQVTEAPNPTANVWVTFGAGTTPTQVLTNVQLPAVTASQLLMIGFGASTGGYNNNHEVRNVVVSAF